MNNVIKVLGGRGLLEKIVYEIKYDVRQCMYLIGHDRTWMH